MAQSPKRWQPDVAERLLVQGVDPVGSMPEDFAAYVHAEIGNWATAIKASGVKSE